MSNDAQKADQIAFHFYTKLFHVVNEARATVETRNQSRLDKWFNLETPDSDLFTKEARDRYKSVSGSQSQLQVQVLLTVPDVNNNQVLVHIAPDSSRLELRPTPKQILLENWVLAFTPRDTATDEDVSLPKIYKHGIPLFRSLYSLLRILPAWKLCKRLRRRIGSNANLSIQLGINQDDSGILGFESPPAPNTAFLQTQTHTFPAVPHPMGTLSLTATYLTAPTFRLDDLESLLSSRFLSEGPEFVPTLAKNQQRDSISGSSPLSSLPPARTSLPMSKSPPSSITVAERFILPSRTTSTTGKPSISPRISPRNVSVPLPRPTSGEPGSASTSSREDPVSRLRRESTTSLTRSGTASGIVTGLTSGSSSDLPGIPLPIPPPRRPNINPVHPFKTNALSSTSSLLSNSPKQQQPLQGLSSSPLSLHSLPPSSSSLRGITTSTPPQASSTTSITRFPTVGPTPPSPIGIGMTTKASPSSLGDRRSLVGTDGGTTGSADSGGGGVGGGIPTRKRYSSSFGHRYAASGGAASDGERSTGSGSASATAAAGTTTAAGGGGGGGGGERTASFLGTTTDDDDISEFVQDIDRRVPLGGGRRRMLSLQPDESKEVDLSLPSPELVIHDREQTVTVGYEQPLTPLLFSPDRELPEVGLGGGSRTRILGGVLSTSPSAGTAPMLTSEDEVDEKLRKMNEVFLKSLEGFSGTSSSRSRSRSEGTRGSVRSRREREGEGEGSREGPVTTGQVAAMMLRDRQDSPSLRASPHLGGVRDILLEAGSSGGSGNVSANASIIGQGSEEVIGRLEFTNEEMRGMRRTRR